MSTPPAPAAAAAQYAGFAPPPPILYSPLPLLEAARTLTANPDASRTVSWPIAPASRRGVPAPNALANQNRERPPGGRDSSGFFSCAIALSQSALLLSARPAPAANLSEKVPADMTSCRELTSALSNSRRGRAGGAGLRCRYGTPPRSARSDPGGVGAVGSRPLSPRVACNS